MISGIQLDEHHSFGWYTNIAERYPNIDERFRNWDGDPDRVLVGILERHDISPNLTFEPGSWCGGGVYFVPTEGTALWTVDSLDPLTISPSVLCRCGEHGWIRNGIWVPARPASDP